MKWRWHRNRNRDDSQQMQLPKWKTYPQIEKWNAFILMNSIIVFRSTVIYLCSLSLFFVSSEMLLCLDRSSMVFLLKFRLFNDYWDDSFSAFGYDCFGMVSLLFGNLYNMVFYVVLSTWYNGILRYLIWIVIGIPQQVYHNRQNSMEATINDIMQNYRCWK